MARTPEPSDALVDLVCFTFEHALTSIERGGPLVPMGVTESRGQRSVMRFAAEMLEEGVEQGRRALGSLSPRPERAVLAFDGFYTGDGKRTDAIFVEAQDVGGPGYIFFMRYRPAGGLRRRMKPLDERPRLADTSRGFL